MHCNKGITAIDDEVENASRLRLRDRLLIRQSAFHLIRPEFTGANLTGYVQEGTLAVLHIVAPLTIVDCLLACVVEATAATALAINILTDIDVAGGFLSLTTMAILTVVLPCALVHGAIILDELACALLHEELVLAVVDVTVNIEQLANSTARALLELTLIDGARTKQQLRLAMELVIEEGAPIPEAI